MLYAAIIMAAWRCDMLYAAIIMAALAGGDWQAQAAAVLAAIEQVESGGRADVVGDCGRAVGILQIHACTVADANRIVGEARWTLEDRLDPAKSRAIWWAITTHYSKGKSQEVMARRWAGGPTGERKAATRAYWRKVRSKLAS